MRIDINGVVCEMPPEVQRKMLDYIQADMEQRYAKDMDGAMKAVTKAFTRKVLLDMERKARKASGDELASHFRPPKGTDPNLFLAKVLRDFGEEALRHVCLYISLAEDGESYVVSDLSAGRIESNQSQAGRQMVGSRDDGIGQDYFLEAPGDQFESAVS